MIECQNLIEVSKASQQKQFYEGRYDELERIRERLHALKETIRHFSDTLSDNDVALNHLTRVVDEDNFYKNILANLTLDCNGVIPFLYVSSGRVNLSPMLGAHAIDIDQLRKMIVLILKIKIPRKQGGRLKRNNNKRGKLLY
jgi:hypothetical protein